MKITTIIGARPQFIKAATISRALREHHPDVREVLVHTGQHYDANMSDVFFDELDIPRPDYNLGIGGGTHGQNTGRMIEQIEDVLIKERPDWVLVYGDTDSTLAGALAAVKLHIPLAHVEAGLRSFNRRMPEEINRILTDHAANLLFPPTDTATQNLSNEGISGDKVQQVGDVMYDAALYYSERAEQRSRILDTLGLEPKNYILATIHRAENTDDPVRMNNILAGFSTASRTIILPLHPRTRKRFADFGLALPPTVRTIDPVGYLDMVMLEKKSALIATDSGGVQKEAYFHSVPCVTLRDETEWVELVDAGVNRLVAANKEAIASELRRLIHDYPIFELGLYGHGDSSEKILNILTQ
ncbi:MAG: UDP-N-acetylglucosamine 2-epimerase (non-hydrolyzing) [Halothiobacillus sp.]|jgi:UDP-GlcNAc3NAcA epimerase|nr:UDP-N-acetylglucosamine 2-epimerase (non-hydrolyzing) [Halothiobacillus sp.]